MSSEVDQIDVDPAAEPSPTARPLIIWMTIGVFLGIGVLVLPNGTDADGNMSTLGVVFANMVVAWIVGGITWFVLSRVTRYRQERARATPERHDPTGTGDGPPS